MPEYLAPGVYVEEVSFRAPSIEGVGTTTTAFVGPTLTGPVAGMPYGGLPATGNPVAGSPSGGIPELLTSFGDFQYIYGGYDNLSLASSSPNPAKNINYMAMAVKAFFDNGGSMLYVSRVYANNAGKEAGSIDPGIATSGAAGADDVAVAARFPGAFLNDQVVTIALNASKTQNVSNLPLGSLLAVPGTPPTFYANGSSGVFTMASAIPPADFAVAWGASKAFTAGQFSTDPNGNVQEVQTAGTSGAAQPAAWNTAYAGLTTDGSVTWMNISLPKVPSGAAATWQKSTAFTAGQFLTDANGNVQFVQTAGTSGGTPPAWNANSGGTTIDGSVTWINISTALSKVLPSNLCVLTLKVTAPGAAGQNLVYDNLGLDPNHPNYIGSTLGVNPPRHIDALQNQIWFQIGSGLTTPDKVFTALFSTWSGSSGQSVTLTMGTSGDDGAEPMADDYVNPLYYCEPLEDVAIVATPGASIFADSNNIMIGSLIPHVERQRAYRVAILEAGPNLLDSDYENVRAQIDSSYSALYVPWVITPNPLAVSGTSTPAEIAVPPSGFMAGIYARSDNQNSVAKAPANEVVLGAVDFERHITFAEQAVLNPLGINCLRFFPDRGYRVWGARTASSDTELTYINVRRYLIYLEHSIDNGTQWAVFENNGPSLWARVKDSIDSFLNNEFAEGNLLGTSPSDAYFVRCDRTTMTQNDLDNGRMICLIGVALLKPAEFVIFRIGQMTSGARS